jgi:hypothetical protein
MYYNAIVSKTLDETGCGGKGCNPSTQEAVAKRILRLRIAWAP